MAGGTSLASGRDPSAASTCGAAIPGAVAGAGATPAPDGAAATGAELGAGVSVTTGAGGALGDRAAAAARTGAGVAGGAGIPAGDSGETVALGGGVNPLATPPVSGIRGSVRSGENGLRIEKTVAVSLFIDAASALANSPADSYRSYAALASALA